MKCRNFLAAVGLLALGQTAIGSTGSESFQRSSERGKTMFLYDRAAWVTSDDMINRLPADRHREVGGWVVTPTTNGLHVDYFGKDDAANRVVYAADVTDKGLSNTMIYPSSGEPVLSDIALKMMLALHAAWREMASHSDWKPCANARFNTIVLPPEADGSVPVYFLTPQTETALFPFGGHFEVDVASDGTISNTRAFTHGCIALQAPSQDSGSKPAALVITHLLDPIPTEIHVFEQLYTGVPVFVMTGPKTVWKVQDGTIVDISAMMKR